MIVVRKEIKLGIAVVATIAIACFTVNYLRGKDLFGHDSVYIVNYDDISYLKASAPIYIDGYAAGYVKSVKYLPQSKCFEAQMAVSDDFEIPDDSVFEIYSSDIMGGKAVRVLPGSSLTVAVSGSSMRGTVAPDMLSSTLEGLSPLIASVTGAADSLSCLAGSLNRLVQENGDGINETVRALNEGVDALNGILSGVSEMTPALKEFVDNANSISSTLEGKKGDMARAISNLDSLSASIKDARIDQLSLELTELLGGLNSGKGSAGKLLSQDTLYTNVTGLVARIDSLVSVIASNPKKYLKISVF